MPASTNSDLPQVADFGVLIPAAGRSLRYGAGHRSKLAEVLGDHSVLYHSVAAFVHRPDVAVVILAVQDEAGARILLAELASHSKLAFAPGGTSRAASVRHALEKLPPTLTYVAVHDAARPLISQPLITQTFAATREHRAAAPALPVTLTIKQASGPLPSPVTRTIPRQTLYAMQTPQCMRRTDLIHAYNHCPVPLEQITDDLQLLELASLPAMLIPGDERNVKITHPPDLSLAQSFLNTRTPPL